MSLAVGPARDRALGISPLDDFPGLSGSARLADRTGFEPRLLNRPLEALSATLPFSFACCTKILACCVRFAHSESGEYDRQRFDEHLDRYLEADSRRIITSSQINPSTGLLYAAALTIAMGLLGYNVVVNDQISIATMLILLVSLAGLAYPISEWLRLGKSIRQANRSARGVFEFLERRPELHQNVGAHFLNALKEQITFENVELESRSGRRLLEGLSLEIPANSRTAIMGQDEDAKLALVCLIPRLIDPRAGRVLIDGHDLRDATFESVRAQVATVLQADLVFTDSVMVNIGLGDPVNTLPRVIEAAKLAMPIISSRIFPTDTIPRSAPWVITQA